MVNCFLCFREGRKNRFVDFNAILGDDQTVADAVRIYFPFIPESAKEGSLVCLTCFETMTTFNELYGIVQKNHNFPIVSIKCEEIEIKAEEPFDAGCLFVTDLQSSCDQTQNHETEMKFESFQDEVAQILMLAKTCKLETKKSNKFKRPPNKVDKDEDYCPGRNIENLQLPCQICKRKFVSESTYQRHVDEAHLGKLYCEKCKFLSTPETYNRHMELHKLDGQEFQCLLCKKRNYTSYYQLKNHMRKCWGKPPKKPKEHFLCDFCPFTSLRKVSFASHIERHKANRIVESGGGIECPKCHKKYGTKSILQQHIKTHGKTLHVCEICSKETSHISAHMRMHTNERVQCPICGNMLKNGPAFKRHLLKHEDKAEGRTFPCKECDFRSNSRAGVWNHMNNMHRLKRTLQCQYCPKKLKLPLDLKEHEATHTGIDLYKCEFCDKTFKFGASYRGHRKREHPKEYEQAKPKWMARKNVE